MSVAIRCIVSIMHLISSCLLNADLDDGVEAWQVQIGLYWFCSTFAAKDEGPFNGFVDTKVPEL